MTIEEFMEFVTICKVNPNSQIFVKIQGKEGMFFKSCSFEHDGENNVLSVNFDGVELSLKEAENISKNELKKKEDEIKKCGYVEEFEDLDGILKVAL